MMYILYSTVQPMMYILCVPMVSFRRECISGLTGIPFSRAIAAPGTIATAHNTTDDSGGVTERRRSTPLPFLFASTACRVKGHQGVGKGGFWKTPSPPPLSPKPRRDKHSHRCMCTHTHIQTCSKAAETPTSKLGFGRVFQELPCPPPKIRRQALIGWID